MLIGLLSGILIYKIVSKKDRQDTQNSKNDDDISLANYKEKEVAKDDLKFKKNMVSKFSIQFGFIVIVIFTGWVMLKSLTYLESYFFVNSKVSLMAYIPLFPLNTIRARQACH